MKILFAPLITRLKLNESQERINILAEECIKRGHSVALSINENCNYSKIKGSTIYEAPLPKNWKSSIIKQKLNNDLISKDWVYLVENMRSFSDALYVMGSIGKRYYKKDVNSIINAIDKFKPDIVYSDLRSSAISASLIKKVKIASTITYPLYEYKSQDPCSIDIINNFNKKNKISNSNSFCEFFDKSDLKFVPSIYELQPLAGKSIIFTGPFTSVKSMKTYKTTKKIIIKLQSINQDFLLKETIHTFKNSDFKILLVSSKLKEGDYDNVSVRKNIDTKNQLTNSNIFIHNGENMDVFHSIITNTPQIIMKCNVYFLKYNGYSIQRNNAGIFIDKDDFNRNKLPKIVDKIMKKEKYINNTKKLSLILSQQRGALEIVDALEKLVT